MNTVLSSIAKYFPTVLAGVIAVEQAVAGHPGASKKQILVNAIDTAAKFGEQIGSTEIQLVSTLIDTTVTALNAVGVFGKSAPAPANQTPALAPAQ